ncbi:MAG: hypothetical protein SFV15_02855 [Polyangiaceae bacterium]|nr:hypothetical protein [Polyangiaceae bacterium]
MSDYPAQHSRALNPLQILAVDPEFRTNFQVAAQGVTERVDSPSRHIEHEINIIGGSRLALRELASKYSAPPEVRSPVTLSAISM